MPNILLVVADSGAPTAADTYLEGLLEGLGHTVTLRSDEAAEDTSGMNGVAVAESCSSASLGTKYRDTLLAVVTFEPGHLDEMLMVSAAGGTSQTSEETIDIAIQDHAFVDGPHGGPFGSSEVIMSVASDISWAGEDTIDFGAGVEKVASIEASGGLNVCAFAYESGAALVTGNAPNKRGFLGWPRELTSGNVNASGEAIIENAFAWAFDVTGVEVAWLTA